MKIYTAGSFVEQARIRKMKENLVELGHVVTSTWLYEQVPPVGIKEKDFHRKMAIKDLNEVSEADCLILDVDNPTKTMGKNIEFGFALAKHKLLYVVGDIPPAAIFMTLADGCFANWDDLLKYFEENHKGQ